MCCDTNLKQLCDKVDCTVADIPDGIQITMKPKDKSKIKSLQNLIKSCKDFSDCNC